MLGDGFWAEGWEMKLKLRFSTHEVAGDANGPGRPRKRMKRRGYCVFKPVVFVTNGV